MSVCLSENEDPLENKDLENNDPYKTKTPPENEDLENEDLENDDPPENEDPLENEDP